jgi:uncharacterized membrane-anchored protein YitT (DUF2179 family)
MSVIQRISPGSAFKVGMVIYGILGVVGALFLELFVLSRMNLPGATPPPRNVFPFGPGALLVIPLIYALIGGIFAALGALIYNVASKWVGGLEVEIN